jgi:hypothetical protein
MAYDIDGFWKQRFSGMVRPASLPNTPGWSIEPAMISSFVEAELRLRDDYDDLAAPIWFVAAPGAVGKSTLAKAISARTNAVYLDLAKAETVAGNYLTGGLVKNQLLDEWRKSQTTILIDALDEARLRVTQNSFEDFLSDVETLARGRKLPVVFFGRVGIVDEAWLILSDNGLFCPIFDIGFFDRDRSELFIMATLDRLARDPKKYSALATGLSNHRAGYQRAISSFVTGLEKAASADGSKFFGYAPVLEAVATSLAEVTNPARLNDEAQKAMQGEILIELSNQILDREATKLRNQLPGSISESLKLNLYERDEQLTRLGGQIYQLPVPLSLKGLSPELIAAYENAVSGFLPNHPFLDGTSRNASGAVFAAAINGHALFSKSREIVSAAQQHAGNGPHTPNPFLIDFYLSEATRGKEGHADKLPEVPLVPPEDVVALYESVRARAAARDIVRLTVEGEEGDEADVEILIMSAETQIQFRIQLRTSQAGALRFGRQVNGVAIDAPQLDVIIGSGYPVEIVAPVSINVARISFDCPELVVARGDRADDSEDTAVILEARELLKTNVNKVPVIRKGAELSVWWPNATNFPWSHFAGPAESDNGTDIGDGLRALRRLILAFRSHSRGRLARFRGKIEHTRMTKGQLGVEVREKLIADKVLSLDGEIYYLDSSALGRVVGATYQDLKLRRFSEKARNYVTKIVRGVHH